MASRFFAPTLLHRPFLFASLGLSSSALFLFASPLTQRHGLLSPLRLDSSPSSLSSKDWSTTSASQRSPKPSPRTVRQLSTGSITGLAAGLALSLFSKPLVLLIGLLIVGVQTAESYGIKLVPYGLLQRYVRRNVDWRSMAQENVALKLSFGAMFALSAFAEF